MLNFDMATPEGSGNLEAETAAVNLNAVPKQQGGNIVYVVVQPTATEDGEHFRKTFPAKIVTKVAALQLVVFLVAIIIELLLITHHRYGPPITVGSGIWACVFLGVTGGLGILAGWKPTSCTIIGYLVLSVISAVFSIFPIVLGGIGVGHDNCVYDYETSTRKCGTNKMTAFYGALCFCGLCQLVMCVTTAVFSCRAVCCRSGKTTGAVVYNANSAGAGGEDAVNAASGNAAPTQVRAALLPSGTVPVPAGGSAQVKAATSQPPKYEDLESGNAEQDQDGQKYSRFQ